MSSFLVSETMSAANWELELYNDDVLDLLPSAEDVAAGRGPTLADNLSCLTYLHHGHWEDGILARFPKKGTDVVCLEGILPVVNYARTSTVQNAVVHGRPTAQFVQAFVAGDSTCSKYMESRAAFVCVQKIDEPHTSPEFTKIHFCNKEEWVRDVYGLSSVTYRFATVLRSTFFNAPLDLADDFVRNLWDSDALEL